MMPQHMTNRYAQQNIACPSILQSKDKKESHLDSFTLVVWRGKWKMRAMIRWRCLATNSCTEMPQARAGARRHVAGAEGRRHVDGAGVHHVAGSEGAVRRWRMEAAARRATVADGAGVQRNVMGRSDERERDSSVMGRPT